MTARRRRTTYPRATAPPRVPRPLPDVVPGMVRCACTCTPRPLPHPSASLCPACTAWEHGRVLLADGRETSRHQWVRSHESRLTEEL